MNTPSSRLHSRGGEAGAVLVMVALWLPVLAVFMSLVVDVGNWFEHKRHLQLQADAAAFAGGGVFRYPACDSSAVTAAAQAYGGGTYNAQVGGTPPSKVHMLINSKTYYGQSSPVDNAVDTRDPCTASMLDVKLTETDLPWLLKASKLVPFINAHARVSLRQIDTQTGSLPVGVPDVNPKKAAVTFFDEATGATLATAQLTRVGTDAQGNALWDNSGAPASVSFQKSGNPQRMDVGVRIALSGGSSTNCGDPMVECYTDPSGSNSNTGLFHIRGYSMANQLPSNPVTQGTPVADEVSFVPAGGSCPDPYFETSTASCTVVLQAKVSFGASNPVSSFGASLTAKVNGNSVNLTFDSTTGVWTSGAITIPAGAGPLPVDLQWNETKGTWNGNACKTGGGNKCTGDLGNVQRIWAGSSSQGSGGYAGPITLAQVWEGVRQDTGSFEMCSSVQASCTHDLVVHIAVKGSLKDAASVSDPLVALRLAGNGSNSSRNQSLDCDPNQSNLKSEIANGCGPIYTKNTGQVCPSSSGALWAGAQPWNCVAVQTGFAVSQVADGMSQRVLGSSNAKTCTSPNHWSQFPNLPAGDPRIVSLILVPYGSFAGSGSGTVPVLDFAYFYVTGWAGQGGNTDPCTADDPAQSGFIVGHFIKYIQGLDNASGSTPCDPNAFGGCVVQLTE
jgi:hypothetical protein